MEISVMQEQGQVPVTIFHIHGDIDTNTYEQLERQAREAYAAGTRNLILDLSEVGYISSAGVRALTSVFQMLRANNPDESQAAVSQGLRDGTYKSRHLKLLNPTGRVREVLVMSGVDMLFEIHRDLPAALASFR